MCQLSLVEAPARITFILKRIYHMKHKSDWRAIGPSNRVWRSALMVCWDSKTVMGLMCSSERGRGKRDGGGSGDQEGNGTWVSRWVWGKTLCHTGLKEEGPRSGIALKCHVSCLRVHVFVFTPCSSRISAQWGATVRRIFQHLEVLLSGALYESFPPWTRDAWAVQSQK